MDATLKSYPPARQGRLPRAGVDESAGADAIRRVRLLDAALSAISDFAYSFDREGRFLYVNKALLDLWGLPLEQAVGKNFYDLKYPDELAGRLQRQIEEVFLRRTVVRDETEYVSPSGVVGYYEYIFSPIFAADGSIEAVAGTTRDITNRVKLERDLRDSELRMEAALAGGHTGTWTWRPQQDRVVASEVTARFFFLGAEEAGGAPMDRYLEAVHPDDRQRVARRVRETARSGMEYVEECRLVGPEKSVRWVEVRATPMIPPAGGGVVFSGVVIDITKSKEKEAEDAFLSDLSARLASHSGADGLIATATERLGTYLNVQRCYFFEGVGDDRILITRNWTRPGVPSMAGEYAPLGFGTSEWWRGIRTASTIIEDTETDARVDASAHAAIAMRSFASVPYLRDGVWVAGLAVTSGESRSWRQNEVRLLENVIARVWPMVERARLMVELQANQNTLELQRSVLEMIINDAPLVEILEQLTVDVENLLGRRTKSAILLAEPSGRILRPVAGRRLSAAWLRTIDQVPVDPGFGSGGAAAYRRERVIVADTARDPRWETLREQALKDDLRACWSTPILSSAGEVLGIFAVYHPEPAVPTARDMAHVDILTRTASIAIERDRSRQALTRSQQTLAEHAAALETHVTERTAQLQETISELETFSYSISHDLRAPLRAMQSFAQILEEECGDKVGDLGLKYARRIVTAAERMDRLIQDVLTYSRISRTNLVLGKVDLETLLAGILEGYPQFQPPKALITVVHPIPPVLGNMAALTQCLSNLVANAVKFVPIGVVPQVSISADLRDRRVIVSVRDNGIGIDPRAHEKIFGIFYRMSRDYEGTGIGLAVARRSAERMGGSITLESAPGQGSIFRLELAAAL